MLFKVNLYYTLTEKIKVQVDKLLDECFGTRSGQSTEKLEEQEDRFFSNPFAFLLAIEKNSVIGVIELHKREINYQGRNVVLGGFGGVCTKKSRRRRGVATTLLNYGLKELRYKSCDIAYICTDVDDPVMLKIYYQAGFISLNKPYTYIGKSGKRYTEKDGMIAPIKSKEKFDIVMKGKDVFDIGIGNW